MFLPGCDAILDSSIWGHARYVYVRLSQSPYFVFPATLRNTDFSNLQRAKFTDPEMGQ